MDPEGGQLSKAALGGTSCQPSRPGDGTVARVGGFCSWTRAWPVGRTPQSPRLRGHPSTGHISIPPAARGAHILCLVDLDSVGQTLAPGLRSSGQKS